MSSFREKMLTRLRKDLVGHVTADEILEGRPTERYLTGILFPQGEKLSQEEDDSLPDGGNDDGGSEAVGASETVSLGYTVRPATAAISFAVEHEGTPELEIEVIGARYEPIWNEGEKYQVAGNAKWQRKPQHCKVVAPQLDEHRVIVESLDSRGIANVSLRLRWARTSGTTSIITVALVNEAKVEHDKIANEKNALFQVEICARATGKTKLIPRPSRRAGEGDELKLLYRNALEYAVGHTCSADWDDAVTEVRTTWVPAYVVPAISAGGQESCAPLRDTAFSPDWLAIAKVTDLRRELNRLPTLYREWLAAQKLEPNTPASMKKQAELHMKLCEEAAKRMEGSISLLCDEKRPGQKDALVAFRLAMRAMSLQRKWAKKGVLTWFPFQLGFQLLALESLAVPDHQHRALMDLLWFPTGGGKTEAYLGLVAFLLFHRRFRYKGKPDVGAGTAAIMRYTLRLLTIQQFQRAARLICACEHLRRKAGVEPGIPDLGQTPFSIGLWVGGDATPNTVAAASETIGSDSNPTAKQMKECPCCEKTLTWQISSRKGEGKQCVLVRCKGRSCELAADDDGYLPIWTVDENIYDKRPSLIIGTADKFTQIVRKPSQTIKLFGGAENDPPDLILQDELHLISGPLGSLAGLYEMAIDELCTRRDASDKIIHRPKIIGSTATIRAADSQVTALFARETRQFPPPELSAETGFFARYAAEKERPGRLYVGITSAGRSPKFALQALYASLLQSARAIPVAEEKERDPWWTLIGYFNSLRELGGSLVMLSDDVPVSIGVFARARNEEAVMRKLHRIDELTSRKSQVDLRDTLQELEQITHPSEGVFDAVLATNMISVGVDVDRLGTMAVTNQPKQMAEYIQATSRVGRKHPGIVVTMYNNNRARDRSHYETFRSWHQALYRDVEATSVTPLAPRARDKALHAALVALVAAQIAGLRTTPKMTQEKRKEIEDTIVKRLNARAQIVDKSEHMEVAKDIQRILDRWSKRVAEWTVNNTDSKYWMDSSDERSLLMSAEKVVAHTVTGKILKDVMPTLNSLRNVEASAPYALLERIPVDVQEESDVD